MKARKLVSKITDYLQAHEIKMVVLNGYADVARILIIRWAKKHGVHVLLRGDSNIHGQEKVTGIRRLFKGLVLRWVSRQISGLMPMGRCGQAFFDHWMGAHNLPSFLCPYEPDYKYIRACAGQQSANLIQKYQLDLDRKRLMFCGRLIDIKNVDLIIEAFKRIAAQRPQWDLVIAGSGELEDKLKKMVSTELASRIKFVGFLQFDQTAACYAACHALVHPPSYEPWALVINEAVAAGLPIISTDVVGAANELIEPDVNGLLIKPNDVDALTDAKLKITEGDTATRMGQEAAHVLNRWQEKADPVMGIVNAAAKFA
ncbi:MAG: glycosyltransferase family 4 protein [Phycisphaeraceae bacterium]|nr:glycosyltransferase family 4 protein [Phycisphaeraceae bacterium]